MKNPAAVRPGLKRATVARIDEARCIGCARCITACPVDAIIGAEQWMHTVVADWCTGCTLCLPACPVDCIEMRAPPPEARWGAAEARAAKRRQAARRARAARDADALARAEAAAEPRAVVAAAIERARNRRA